MHGPHARSSCINEALVFSLVSALIQTDTETNSLICSPDWSLHPTAQPELLLHFSSAPPPLLLCFSSCVRWAQSLLSCCRQTRCSVSGETVCRSHSEVSCGSA